MILGLDISIQGFLDKRKMKYVILSIKNFTLMEVNEEVIWYMRGNECSHGD